MKRFSFILFLFAVIPVQSQSLKIIGETELNASFQAGAKTRIVNFWATWCKPCVEEMPLFVKADSLLGEEVEFVFVSFDMLKDSGRVNRKIAELKMPGMQYLVKVKDMDALINGVDSLWGGALPVTWRIKEGLRIGKYESFEQFDDLRGFIEDNIKKEE
jgi:thiol-disulfide isomerase/thioredoxin